MDHIELGPEDIVYFLQFANFIDIFIEQTQTSLQEMIQTECFKLLDIIMCKQQSNSCHTIKQIDTYNDIQFLGQNSGQYHVSYF